MIPFPDKKYNIIYADPPWSYRVWNKTSGNGTRNASTHYQTMSKEQICDLPIKQIASKNCALLIWVTSPLLPEGLEVIKAWGFEYKTVAFVWIKVYPTHSQTANMGTYFTGLGHYTRSNSESCLLAIKGTMKRQYPYGFINQAHTSPIRKHSQKPDIFRERIVKLFGDLPRIELFARNKIAGWDSWGNEIVNVDQPTLMSY